MQRILSIALTALIVWGSIASTAAAEPPPTEQVPAEVMFDLYAAATFTNGSRLTRKVSGSAVTPLSTTWGSSGSIGARGIFWLGGKLNWLGAAVDLSYYGVETSTTSGLPGKGLLQLHLIPISPLLMIRIPLAKNDANPGGRVQPYAAIGPALTTSVANGKLIRGSESSFDVGLDYRFGIKLQPVTRVGVFLEYRYTDITVQVDGGGGNTLSTPITSSHAVAGVTLSF